MPSGELQLQEPPSLPEATGGMSSMITYLPMGLMSMSMGLMFLGPGRGGGALTYVAMGMMAVSVVGMVVAQLLRSSGERKRKLKQERRDYLRYLTRMRRQVRKMIVEQQQAQEWRHPDPSTLWSLARSSRLWERRLTHDDFGEIRVAVGDQRLGVAMAPISSKPVEDLEPLAAHALRRFIRAYSTVADQPIALFLPAYSRVLLQGDLTVARRMVQAMVAQLAVFHSPDDLRIVVVAADRRGQWEWVKWLPHALHPVDVDGAGPVRMVLDAVGQLEQVVGEELIGRASFDPDAEPTRDEPYTVLVLDTDVAVPSASRLAGAGYRNTTVVDVGGALEWKPGRAVLRLRLTPNRLEMLRTDSNKKETAVTLGRPDLLRPAGARALAAQLAPYRLSMSTETTEPLSTDFELTTLLGIPDLAGHDVARRWEPRGEAGRLRVPLGVAADGSPVELDIKESAQGGMGPHGMLIGATGSGKSELLRTLVLALALTHSSETLNLVLVDFKGGATFLGLDALPHTSAVITNLADEDGLVERMKDALHGELVRRQELLRRAGNFTSALEYERARASGTPLDPLPTLFVVVDEFSELLAAHRDFMDLFIMIGRLGRSLGVHLLLASQRLDEGRMHQLESHLSYRIGLRTFSAMESRGVLGVADAYQLPPQPGNGYLKTDVDTLIRFKAAYVSGPYQPSRRSQRLSVLAGQIVPYTSGYVVPRQLPQPAEPAAEPVQENTRSLLEVAVERLRDAGPPAYQVWLPPLDVPPTLDELLPALAVDPQHGLTSVGWAGRGGLAVPVGVVDRPFEQLRDLLMADVSGSGGHVGIAGGPQSGKSTLVRTLITSLALTHTPKEVQFYCLDFGGGTLSGLADLPHIGGITGRLDTERVGRTIAEVTSLIARRERQFTEWGVDSMAVFRQRRAAGEFADEPFGDAFLVVDGWSTVRQDFMDLLPVFTLIAARGLNFGVHLIVASTRWGEISGGLRDQLGTRFELRLGDPVDSVINMRVAGTVPKVPGRGLTDKQLHFLTALPRIDGVGSSEDLRTGISAAATAIASAWTGPSAPPVRMLPHVLDAAALPAPEGDLRVALGIEEQELAPLWHDFEEAPHLIVAGDAETGKTNLLKLVAKAVMRRYSPAEARVMLVDYRRQLFDVVPEEHRLGYAVSVDLVRQAVDGVARAMQTRLPGPDVTPAQLRKRDWWTGPRLFLLVDDYEMVASTGNSPFGPLLDFLAQGNELGLHLIVVRSANGLARASNDPLLRRLLEVNTPALLLSCPPSEGYVFGNVKPRQMPPGRGLYITRRRTLQAQTALLADEPVGTNE
jgi:S-DNA-T family DNA segregation ATPase FtsK/SpoIIIE